MTTTVSIVPAIIDALVAAATSALPGVTVTDGQGVTGNTNAVLMIGVNSPDITVPATAANSQQAPATYSTNRTRDETGDVYCTAVAWNGNNDQKQARDDAFALAEAVADLCRTNPSLGLSAGGYVVCGYGGTGQLDQDQDDSGATASLVFSVAFRARI